MKNITEAAVFAGAFAGSGGGGGGGGTDEAAVHYNRADGKSDAQKAQARQNIGVDLTELATKDPATAVSAGLMSAEAFSKLAGIEAGAEVNDVTDVQVDGASVVEGGVADLTNAFAGKLDLAGGTMTGTISSDIANAMQRSVDTDALCFYGGAGRRHGARVALFGSGHGSSPGAFLFEAWLDSSNNKTLLGKPDGTLIWDGSDILTVAMLVNDLTSTDTNKALTAAQGKALNEAKQDKPAVKTVLDETLAVNSCYFLSGNPAAVAFTLPTTAAAGDEITIVWYNGSTAATLTITGSYYGNAYTPAANKRSELNFLYDGTAWAMVSNEVGLAQ